MLHGSTGRFFLLFCSSSAFARALISLVALSMSAVYSPTSTTVISPPWQQQARAASTKKHQPHAHPLPSGVVEDNKDRLQLLLVAPPPPAPSFFTSREREEETTKKNKKAPGGGRAISRPPRLVIPPAPRAAAAGVDPFGAAADRETDVATEVEVQGEGFCLASRRGVRHAMEDGYDVITTTADEKGGGIGGRSSQLAFYGVYDGHGGRAAVDFVADKLGKNVVAAASTLSCRRQEEEGGGDDDEVIMAAAIQSAYLTTDSELLSQGTCGGTCAATALVKDGDLYVANVGDCRAVLGSSSIAGGVAATELTIDHTAGHEGERRRVEAQGGYVSCGSTGVWRVQDSLAVTRAFGDASLKPCGVTAEPEVSRRRITPDCRFLVLASDGLWNKVSSQEAVDVVVSANAASNGSHQACKELVATARSRGSRDDVTVMVVDLQRFLLHR